MPRVEGRAQVHTLDFGKAQARAASGEWGGGALWGLYVMNALVSEHVVSCMRNPMTSFMIKCRERERERERVLLGAIHNGGSRAAPANGLLLV